MSSSTPSLPPTANDTEYWVLVADDEAHIVDFLGLLLEGEGFGVLRAYDGRQAWEITKRRAPDLVICDLMMPKMSGAEFVDRIRDNAHLRDTPIIMMSAAHRNAPVDGVHFLPKPFDINAMLDIVTEELIAS